MMIMVAVISRNKRMSSIADAVAAVSFLVLLFVCSCSSSTPFTLEVQAKTTTTTTRNMKTDGIRSPKKQMESTRTSTSTSTSTTKTKTKKIVHDKNVEQKQYQNQPHESQRQLENDDKYNGNSNIISTINFSDGATTRAGRFPSVEQRVKLYMANWYVPPCQDYQDGHIFYRTIGAADSEDDYEDDNSDDSKEKTKKKKKKKSSSFSSSKSWPSVQVEGYRNHPLVNQTERIIRVESIVEPDMMFFMDHSIIYNCANETHYELHGDKKPNEGGYDDPTGVSSRTKFRINMKMYCEDVKQLLLPALSHVELERRRKQKGSKSSSTSLERIQSPPTLLQFGDNKQSHIFGDVMVPHIKKFRSSASTLQDLADVTSEHEIQCLSAPRQPLKSKHGDFQFQPIIWKLATDRHYKKLYQVYREDTPWYKKKDMAIFRGQLTGSRDGYDKELSDEQNCHNLKRCRLVYDHANSTLIDARLTSTRGRLPSVLNSVPLEGDKVRVFTLLEYKGIIMIEGNDVASGLKWALLSQSVVLMPPPKHTSWAMEELLQPWVVCTLFCDEAKRIF